MIRLGETRRWRNRLLGFSILMGLALLLATVVVPGAESAATRPATTFGEKALLALFAIGATGVWVSSIAHARYALAGNETRRRVVWVLLLIGNFVGGLIYLLAFALWESPEPAP